MPARMTKGTTESFEKRLLFAILLIDLLFALMAGTYLVGSYRNHQDLLKATGNNLVKLLGRTIEDKARLVDDAVVRVERALELQLREGGIDRNRLDQVLDREHEQLPEIDGIRITDAQGDVLFGKGVGPATKASYADRLFFQQHKGGLQQGLIISEPLQGKVSGKWVLGFTRAYRGADDAFAGVVTAAVPVETFEYQLRSVSLNPSDTVVLRHSDLGLVARVPNLAGDAGRPGHNQVSKEFTDIIASGRSEASFHTAQTPDGVERTYFFRRLANPPFIIAVGLVEEEYLAPWRSQALWVGLLFGVFFVGTSAAAWLTIRHLRQRTVAEAEVFASERRFRRLFEANAAMMLLIDPDTGGIVEANRAAAAFYGWPVEDLKRMGIQEINTLPPDAVMAEMARTRALGSLRLEFQHRKAEGSIHDVEVFSSSVEVAGKTLLYSIIHDISERKKFHEALLNERQRLESIIAGTGVGTWQWNVQSGETEFNDRWADMVGYTLGELAPFSIRTWEKLVHPEDLKLSAEALAKHLAGELPFYQCECRMKHKNGQWIWITDRGRVMTRTSDGKPLMMFGTHTDITERKQAEEQRAKLEALNWQMQKNDSLMRMAAAIAHHFNNQLGAVMGNLEMAIDDLAAGLQPGKSLHWAMQGAKKASEVSIQMLSYLGQTTGVHLPLDLSETCRRFLPLLKAAIPSEVTLQTDFPAGGPTVVADANQLQQVLTNLATNAWESADRGQAVIALAVNTVPSAAIPRTGRWPVDWQPQEKGYACLEIRDNGCGIAEEDFDKLFDPFFSNKFPGRGLGLAAALGIVNAHSGAMAVASQQGQGSVFSVYLPISDEPIAQLTEKTGNSLIKNDKGTLLLIEDEDLLREMAETMLCRMGYKVLTAKNGTEGMKVFHRHRDQIHAVLSDLTMPGMNGWEVRAALNRIRPDIPVIIASGHDAAQMPAGHPADPSAIFLQKPYQQAALAAALAKAMAGRIS